MILKYFVTLTKKQYRPSTTFLFERNVEQNLWPDLNSPRVLYKIEQGSHLGPVLQAVPQL